MDQGTSTLLSVTQKDTEGVIKGSSHPEFSCPGGNWTSTWITLSVRRMAGSLWKVMPKERRQMKRGSLVKVVKTVQKVRSTEDRKKNAR